MAWLIGIDEAGYGPNLGPFVMTAVACRVPDTTGPTDLWRLLASAVRRGRDPADGRLLVDDSKVVFAGARGLEHLEHGVRAVLWGGRPTACFTDYLTATVRAGLDDLLAEPWLTASPAFPQYPDLDLAPTRTSVDAACTDARVDGWHFHTAVLCPARFNALVDQAGTKGAVLADAMASVLRAALTEAPDEAVHVFVDKHGGRNAYAAQLQDALDAGFVVALEEGMARSVYRVMGLGRDVRVTFQPRADGEHFGVALASMVSKYVREVLMGQFNRFWQERVPGLRPTAGYPGDAARFFEAIREPARALGIADDRLWRRK